MKWPRRRIRLQLLTFAGPLVSKTTTDHRIRLRFIFFAGAFVCVQQRRRHKTGFWCGCHRSDERLSFPPDELPQQEQKRLTQTRAPATERPLTRETKTRPWGWSFLQPWADQPRKRRRSKTTPNLLTELSVMGLFDLLYSLFLFYMNLTVEDQGVGVKLFGNRHK